MKRLSASLSDHLKSGATTMAFCWLIRRKDGVNLGFTDHDKALTIEGVMCEPASGFTASQSRESADFSANDQEIQGALSSDWLKEDDLIDGLYNDASIETWRVNWLKPTDRLLMRRGYLGEITKSDQHFSAEIRSVTAKMDQLQGRLFQSGCDANLGDSRCKVDLQSPQWRRKATIIKIETTSRLQAQFTMGEAQVETGFFASGHMEIDTGHAANRLVNIQKHDQNANLALIESWAPLPRNMAVGDEVTLVAGCNRRFGTCQAKFANQLNFQGFPHMPGNDFLLGYPAQNYLKDGSALASQREQGS